MKFRLDVQHYIHDRLLEPGHIVGDETDVPLINTDGSPMIPSRGMTPLDAGAKSLFEKTFPNSRVPPIDATKAIPIRGTGDSAKQAGVRQPGGPVGVTDGGHVIGADGKSTSELKKGLPDSGTPNSPVGRPVIGQVAPASQQAHAPAPTPDPALAVNQPKKG